MREDSACERILRVSGVDAVRGINYQHCHALLVALDVAAEPTLVGIRVEGTEDVLDLEVLHSLRRHVRIGSVSAGRAKATLEALEALPLTRYPHVDLLARIWSLRHNFSGYDAAYVALSEALGASLFTRDAKLAQAARNFTNVQLV